MCVYFYNMTKYSLAIKTVFKIQRLNRYFLVTEQKKDNKNIPESNKYMFNLICTCVHKEYYNF